jgi:hypothetical protein
VLTNQELEFLRAGNVLVRFEPWLTVMWLTDRNVHLSD